MIHEVTITATWTVSIDADNEDEAAKKALEHTLENLDQPLIAVNKVIPDPYNEAADNG